MIEQTTPTEIDNALNEAGRTVNGHVIESEVEEMLEELREEGFASETSVGGLVSVSVTKI